MPTKTSPAQRRASRQPLPAARAPNASDVTIVGVGCSAGGLEALETFLSHVRAASGMAFVVVQHLDPDHPSALPELLQRVTPMPVVEARNRLKIKPDSVYIIPPNKDIALLHGALHLLEPSERRGLRLPVDFFLRTLAEDQRERAVGVVLSGMGSDGMLGLAAIKERSGLTLAQEPRSAKATGMPESAIRAGVVDVVAPADELPERIADYLRHAPPVPADVETQDAGASALAKIVVLLRNRCGNDFSLYKQSTLYRRIERRIALLQLSGIADYVAFLRNNPTELDLLFKELLIGVTHFFRDPPLWTVIGETVLPRLLAMHAQGKALRAWVPACSSGEEAYSLAIVFKETLERLAPEAHFTLQIFATDLDADAVDRARQGFYPDNIVGDVTAARLARYFVREEGGYRVAKEIRETIVFAEQNVISDPPFTKLDLLSCRNLLIYFGAELQKRLLPLFHYALNRDGVLILGNAETVGNFSDLFAPLDKASRVFIRCETLAAAPRPNLVSGVPADALTVADGESRERDYRHSLEYLTDQVIQQNYAPAAVLVSGDGDILYFSGRTGKYLEPAAGKVNVNIYAMARDGLRDALAGVVRGALLQDEAIHLDDLLIGAQRVNVTVQAITKPAALRGRVLIVFTDVVAPAGQRKARRGKAAAGDDAVLAELRQARQALRTAHEEMQTSMEETKSANEELQASNEELTTSKEELQSLNEELQTVNAELQSKVDDLTWAKNDMANLLNSTEIATIFLDNQMKLRRYTTHATQLFKFIPGDIGRPLSDIVTDLDYPQLKDDAESVLATLVFRERQVSTHDARCYRVRIMPYRTQGNVIDGVVVTFTDITEIKQLEAELRKKKAISQ